MKRKRTTFKCYFYLLLPIICLAIISKSLLAKEMEVIKAANNSADPLYLEFFKVLDQAIPKIKVLSEYKDLRRIIRDVEQGHADFYFPAVCPDVLPHGSNLLTGSERIGYVVIGLFSHKDSPLTVSDLNNATFKLDAAQSKKLGSLFTRKQYRQISEMTARYVSGDDLIREVEKKIGLSLNETQRREILLASYSYKLGTERAYAQYMVEPASSDFDAATSMKNIVRGRLDGYVHTGIRIEKYIAKQNLDKVIHRSIYREDELCFMVANTEKGKRTEAIISKALKLLKENGKFDEIFGALNQAQKQLAEKYRVQSEKNNH